MSPRLEAARRTGMPTEELSMTLRAKEHPPPRRSASLVVDVLNLSLFIDQKKSLCLPLMNELNIFRLK